MSGQEDKNTKSKIEQIREELEKKLAAIEKAKTAPQSGTVAVDKEAIAKELEAIKEDVEIVDKKNDLVFEISDKIEEIKEDTSTKIESVATELNDTVNRTDVEKNIEKTTIIKEPLIKEGKEVSKLETLKKIVKSETNASDNKTTENTKKTIIPPPKTVATAIHVNQQKSGDTNKAVVEEKEEVVYVEEKSKKKSYYLLYALLLLLFGGIAYLLVNYLNQNKEQQKIIMNQKLSEFKNKIYLDSIELADLNNQLIDLQSNKLIDSIDQVYEKELIDNSKLKNKEEVKRSFSVDGNEIVANSKRNKTVSNWRTNTNKSSAKKSIKTNSNVKYSSNTNNGVVYTGKSSNTSSSKNTLNNSSSVNNSQINNENLSLSKNETSIAENSNNNKNKQTVDKLNDSPIEVEKNTPKIIKAPIFPGCEKKRTELDIKRCFATKLYKNVARNFNSSLAQNIGLSTGKHVVKVNFIIDKHGYANVLNVRAADKILEDEAIRVIQALPKMKPGTVNGKQSNIPYNIPIRYIVEN